jgi:Ca2+-binding EF-hand superfamily protein
MPKGMHKGGFNSADRDVIRNAFQLFDYDKTGRVDIGEIVDVMASLGYEKKNPALFEIISNLENDYKNGITFDQFLDGVEEQVSDTTSKDGSRRVFETFSDGDKITVTSIKKSTEELGDVVTSDEVKDLLAKAADNATNMTSEEFYEIIQTQ